MWGRRGWVLLLALLAVALMAPTTKIPASKIAVSGMTATDLQDAIDTGEISGSQVRSAADCSAEPGGVQDDVCIETADDSLWYCSTATCEGAGWTGAGFVKTVASADNRAVRHNGVAGEMQGSLCTINDSGAIICVSTVATGNSYSVVCNVIGSTVLGSATCLCRSSGDDRIFHDANCSGTKTAGEEFIDFNPSTGFTVGFGKYVDLDVVSTIPVASECNEALEQGRMVAVSGAGVADTVAGFALCTQDSTNGFQWTTYSVNAAP